MVVVCGRNSKLQERLRSRPQGAGHCQLHVLGFVDNMHEIMAACDAIITKAGPGTIAEALISGLPILLNGNVPCQVGTLRQISCFSKPCTSYRVAQQQCAVPGGIRTTAQRN